jgi:hypothetical protein
MELDQKVRYGLVAVSFASVALSGLGMHLGMLEVAGRVG